LFRAVQVQQAADRGLSQSLELHARALSGAGHRRDGEAALLRHQLLVHQKGQSDRDHTQRHSGGPRTISRSGPTGRVIKPKSTHPSTRPDMSLKEKLAEQRAASARRIPPERQVVMQRHIEQPRNGTFARAMLKVGDRAPAVLLKNAKGMTVDVATLLKKGPVIVTFYRGGWYPYCNLELKAYQELLPEIAATGASLVAISPEQPDQSHRTKGRCRWRPPMSSTVTSPSSMLILIRTIATAPIRAKSSTC